MASTITADSGGVSGSAGLKSSADSSGILALATGTGTTAVTIDASQNVGIGTASPGTNLQIGNGGGSSGLGVTLTRGATTNFFEAYDGTKTMIAGTDAANAFVKLGSLSNHPVSIIQGNGSAIYVDTSKNVMVGTTASVPTADGFSVYVASGNFQTITGHASGTASGIAFSAFRYNNTGIGSITQNGTTGVLYNLTSDYRLKNDQQPLTGAKEFVMALQPKKWQWWDGSGEGVGFIAHEFMEVAKYSGNGEKDAVDAEGKPIYQSIQPSSSEVMANLVSFIQEQQATIEQLRADVETLKAKP